MIKIEIYIKKTKAERQQHLKLDEACVDRQQKNTNNTSTQCKGLLAYVLNTTIPNGTAIKLCHACNNARCSNPNHLYWGTNSENMQDMIAAGYVSPWKGKKRGPRSAAVRKKIAASMKKIGTNNPKGINGSNKCPLGGMADTSA